MKIEVWTEPPPKVAAPTRVRLIPDDVGRANLCAVQADGDRVHSGLIGILSDKGFKRYPNLSPDLGFPLDDKGRILDV